MNNKKQIKFVDRMNIIFRLGLLLNQKPESQK
jgi:hypothetical protein